MHFEVRDGVFISQQSQLVKIQASEDEQEIEKYNSTQKKP